MYNKMSNTRYIFGRRDKGLEQAYLDNSATTPVCPQAVEAAVRMMTACFGNPSSLHTLGIQAEKELSAARESVARLIGAPAGRLVFTSGGTEANNLAVLGGGAARARQGRHAVTSAVEHASVAAAFDQLEREGWTVERVRPERDGTLTAERIAAACREDTALVSVMLVNNETGARHPLETLVPEIRRISPRALIHTDAVQAAGRIPLSAERMGVDLLTVSGHKLHAPKRVGALYVRKGVRLLPRQIGGGQEDGLRSGTEAAPAIAAFGAAAAAVPPFREQEALYRRLRDRLLERLSPLGVFHLPPEGVPYIVSLSLPGLRSETLLHFLAERGIYVSGGSACSKGKRSPVLTAMGLPAGEIDSALRVSFSWDNTLEEVDRLAEALRLADHALVRRP